MSSSREEQGFTDFVPIGNKVWALTENGSLTCFDLTTRQRIQVPEEDFKINAIAKDRQGSLVVADTKNRIGKYEGGKWLFRGGIYSRKIRAIFYTKQNDPYLLLDDGILRVKDKRLLWAEGSLSKVMKRQFAFSTTTCYMIDDHDNIWMGANYGEWGGNLFIFSTTESRYVTPKLNGFDMSLNPVFSFTQGPEAVYFTGGLSHLGITSGYIGKFENFSFSEIFSNERDEWRNDTVPKTGFYIGPISYNTWDSCVYFYTEHGFYRSKADSNLSQVTNWDFLVRPQLTWIYGQPFATGYAMNVQKLECTGPGAFLFLSTQNRIGYFDGHELTMLQ